MEISERKQVPQRLQHLAYHDVLTNIPNRIRFVDHLKQTLARAQWSKRVVAALAPADFIYPNWHILQLQKSLKFFGFDPF